MSRSAIFLVVLCSLNSCVSPQDTSGTSGTGVALSDWSPEDVFEWVRSLSPKCKEYASIFPKEEVTGIRLSRYSLDALTELTGSVYVAETIYNEVQIISNTQKDDCQEKNPDPRNFDIIDIDNEPPYPRDLLGYGQRTPNPLWPNGALLAISFVNNFEEGSELNILNGDLGSETGGQELNLWDFRFGERNVGVESMWEYGSRAGIWRMQRAFDERGLKLTQWGVAVAYARNPEITRFIFENGHELATHGYRWYDYYGVPEEKEREHLQELINIQQRLTGSRPLGIGIVRRSNNTYRLAMEEFDFEYFSDAFNDDLPYYDTSLETPHLIVPYNLNLNDAGFGSRYGTGKDFYDACVEAIEMLLLEGQQGQPKFLTIALHSRQIGYPGRTYWLGKLLDYILEKQIWVATRLEIARHWKSVFPPPVM